MAQDPNGPPATYLEVMDLVGNVPENRVTRDLTRTRLARDLFTLVGSQVVWAYTANSGAEAVYQFATDPAWDRIVYSKRNSDWINAFGERGTGVFQFDQPLGIDVDMDLNVYVADFGNRRLVVLGFADERLYWQFAFGEDSWHPLDILWDNNGTVGDNADDYLWILHHRVEKLIERRQVDVNTYTVGPTEIEYGGWGSGEGRFLNPSAICIGPAGGGRHSGRIYVVDRGNRRIVRLERPSTTELNWEESWHYAYWDPTSCSVDYDGDVHVTDRAGHKLRKFTWDLEYLKSYGQYGLGQDQFGTFDRPHDISVVWGPYYNGSFTQWTGYGRVVSAEKWADQSGGHDHRLGIEVAGNVAWGGTGGDSVYGGTFSFTPTAAGFQTVDVLDASGTFVDRVRDGYLGLSGTQVVTWDGKMPGGKLGRVLAPEGDYRFDLTVVSHYGFEPQEPFRIATAQSNLFYTNCGGCVVPKSVAPATGPETWSIAQDLAFASDPQPVSPGLSLNVVASALAAGSDHSRVRGPDYAAIRRSGIRAVRIAVPEDGEQAAGEVRLEIYDLAGRRVRHAVREDLPPGWHRYVWDGRDDDGRQVASGVYIVVMQAPGFRGSTKLILIP